MLPDKIKLEIVTPEKLVLSTTVDEVILPSVEGYMGVRPGHAPLLARLDVGEVVYRVAGQDRFIAISGGFAEVLRDRVEILAETGEPAEDIDASRAEQARQRAEKRLKEHREDVDFQRAEVSLKKALNRIQVMRRATR